MDADADRIAKTTSELRRTTAESLEDAEQALHRTAEISRNPDTAARVHQLADHVTAEARRIATRANSADR
jgi:hypothetical protein